MNRHVDISDIDEEEKSVCVSFNRDIARFNGYILPDKFKEHLDGLLNMNVTDDDIWLCSFPKTGTTWAREMVYCVAKDADITAAQIPLEDRFDFLDICFLTPKMTVHNESAINKVKRLFSSNGSVESDQGPRLIHTHLPFELLPKQLRDGSTKAKIVYVVRNPRDACISGFHQSKLIGQSDISMKTYAELFTKGIVMYGPFWKHVIGYWNKRSDQSVLVIKYEDMKKDLPSVIRKTATFLEKIITDEQMGPLCEHLSFETMRKNSSVYEKPIMKALKNKFNPDGKGEFFREGKSDQWKNEFDGELVERFERWEYENLKHLNLMSYNDM